MHPSLRQITLEPLRIAASRQGAKPLRGGLPPRYLVAKLAGFVTSRSNGRDVCLLSASGTFLESITGYTLRH